MPGFLAVSILKSIGCAITGTKIREFAPFGNDTELVGYDIKKAGWIRVTIVNLFTLLATISLFILIAWSFDSRIGFVAPPPEMPGSGCARARRSPCRGMIDRRPRHLRLRLTPARAPCKSAPGLIEITCTPDMAGLPL